MKISTITCAVLVLYLLTPATFVHSQERDVSRWKGACEVVFEGKSSLHNFTGKVRSEPFEVKISGFSEPETASASSSVTVRAEKMKTGNDKRDQAMWKTLNSSSFPEITVSVSDLTADQTKPRRDGETIVPTIIPFNLTVKGSSQRLVAKVTKWSFGDNRITMSVNFPVSLSTTGLKPPSVLGLVKVNDTISVNADLILTRN